MVYRTQTALAATVAFALMMVAMPGPIMIDLLGAGLVTLGLGMIYKRS